MIAIEDSQPAQPQPATIDPARRGRAMFFVALLISALILTAALPPLGAFYPLLYLGGFFAPFFLIPWLFGSVHALYAWRRKSAPATRRALLWWLAPLPLFIGTALLARSSLPHRFARQLASDDLAALRAAADALPVDQISLADRWLGPWPAKDIARYPSGELRMELSSTDSWFGTRGLIWTSGELPLPGRWKADTYRELGDGWFAWFRRAVH